MIVGFLYLWMASYGSLKFASGDPGEGVGMYFLLSRAFLDGHVSLPLVPDPNLLALPDPWDPVINSALRGPVHDISLYHGKFYSYFGPTPALLAFVPYLWMTGTDASVPLVVAAFSFVGFVLYSLVLLRVALQELNVNNALFKFTCGCLTLGFGTGVPFMIGRPAFYEAAIACGFMCSGFFALMLQQACIEERFPSFCLVAAGIALGLCLGCRPDLILLAVAVPFAIFTSPILKKRPFRYFLAFALPSGILLMGLLIYNYERFDSPFEFGQRYQLAGMKNYEVGFLPRTFEQVRTRLVPGLYHYLYNPARLHFNFPFVQLTREYDPYLLRAPNYDNEVVVGILFSAPILLWMVIAVCRGMAFSSQPDMRGFALGLGAAALLLILFISSLAFATARYMVDFSGLLILALAILWQTTNEPRTLFPTLLSRFALMPIVGYIIFFGFFSGIQGYHQNFAMKNPQLFSLMASFFH